jgi:phospholipid/cholesterol/gamma-HCH transport system substrate-binding protein
MRLRRLPPFRSLDPVPIGAVFLGVTILLIIVAFNISLLPFIGGTQYAAAFAEAAGLSRGDAVRIAGIEVGKVDNVALQGAHVKVTFTISAAHVHLGMDSTASIEIFTLLGNKYLALQPAGPGTWPSSREIPLAQTSTPYDVEPAFQDLTRTVSQLNSRQLVRALNTLSTTFENSPPALRSTLRGLSRISETVASRDQALSELLQHAAGLSGVLAQRQTQFVRILTDGDQLLRMLEERQQVISQLLVNTAALSQQLIRLVHDNQAQIGPALRRVNDVATILNQNQNDLDLILQQLYVFVRGEVDATGAGPWFDGTAINVLNPISVSGGTPPIAARRTPPRTLGQLLGVPQ